MIVYKATYKNKILSLLGISTGCLLIIFGILSVLTGSYVSVLLMILPGAILLLSLFYVFPKEILVKDEGIEFIAKVRKIDLNYSDIQEVKPHYTTRTLTISSGDKDKAAVYYSIKVKDKPFKLLLFGSGISQYRDLFERLKRKTQS